MVNKLLTVDTTAVEKEHQLYNNNDKYNSTPRTEASTPSSTYGPVRGRSDIRSPGISKTPSSVDPRQKQQTPTNSSNDAETAIPDFITQTDKYGNASTPRSQSALTPTATTQTHRDIEKSDTDETTEINDTDASQTDACDTLLENLRMMCCCLLPGAPEINTHDTRTGSSRSSPGGGGSERKMQITKKRILPGGGSTYGHVDETSTFHETAQIKLLPSIIPQDKGKNCLVLDLDETLVHSSFRAVSGADFVIPVQIEDTVHYVYVAKRPGVDEFLIEMAKHYEIILYTASLNKYADPLLDLLDPHRTIRTRLFRESCVYYEGNYVKDLSLLNRDLSTTIIVDNSPSSYIFHPENAIDCSSFIDDPRDDELRQIGSFLKGVKNVSDVRSVCSMWREWPHIPRIDNLDYESREDKHGQ
jgi:RNA polymerase II subunit A small phosphatase-like protein